MHFIYNSTCLRAPTKFGKVIGAIKDPNSAIDAGLAAGWRKASEKAEEKKAEKEKEELGKANEKNRHVLQGYVCKQT